MAVVSSIVRSSAPLPPTLPASGGPVRVGVSPLEPLDLVSCCGPAVTSGSDGIRAEGIS